MIEWDNLFNVGLSSYGLVIEGYFGDVYLPYRALILAVLVIAGRKAWKMWKNR